jgi:type IV pilus assembly protein PilM
MKLFTPRRVGIDLGSSSIKIAEVVGVDSYGYAVLRRATIFPIPDGLIVAGVIKNPTALGKALQQAVKKAAVPRQGFILGASSRLVALGSVTSPDAVAPSERISQIRLSQKELSPTVPVQTASISWNLLNTKVRGTNTIENTLNVAMISQDEVDVLLNVARLASLQPRAIDLSAAATLRALVRCTNNDMNVATIVDVGASKTCIATRQGLHLRSLRVVPQGGNTMTRAILNATEASYAEAEAVKLYLRVSSENLASTSSGQYTDITIESSYTPSPAEVALAGVTEIIIDEIAKSIEADASLFPKSPSRGVQLIGGASRVKGFVQKLSTRLGFPVVSARPWADLQFNKYTAPLFTSGTPDTNAISDLTVATGLALWRPPT